MRDKIRQEAWTCAFQWQDKMSHTIVTDVKDILVWQLSEHERKTKITDLYKTQIMCGKKNSIWIELNIEKWNLEYRSLTTIKIFLRWYTFSTTLRITSIVTENSIGNFNNTRSLNWHLWIDNCEIKLK